MRGHGLTLLQGADPANRPSHNHYARTYRGEPGVLLRYSGLDPAAYEVRLTYLAPPARGPARLVQRLAANGREVHGDLALPPQTAQRFAFPIPQGACPFGRLDLEWFPSTAPGSTGDTAVSEVWLRRVSS